METYHTIYYTFLIIDYYHEIKPKILHKKRVVDNLIVDNLEWINVGNPRDSFYPEPHEKQGINIALSNTIKTFWDIGAYHGMYALRLAKSSKDVCAFEPNPKSYEILVSNIKLNKLTIYTMNIAISSFEGTIKLSNNSSISSAHLPSIEQYTTKCQSIDNLIMKQHLPIPDFIKIDTEQHEVEIIKGAIYTLIKYKPQLLIECHHIPLNQNQYLRLNEYTVKEMLNRLGYDWELLDGSKIYAKPSNSKSLDIIQG